MTIKVEDIGTPRSGDVGKMHTEKKGDTYVSIRWEWPMNVGLRFSVYIHNKEKVYESYPVKTHEFKGAHTADEAVAFFNRKVNE